MAVMITNSNTGFTLRLQYTSTTAQTIPTSTVGALSGDLAVVCAFINSDGVPSTTPTGWTAINTDNMTNIAYNMVYRRMDGSESSNVQFFSDIGKSHRSFWFLFTGGSTVSALGINGQTTNGTPTNQTKSISAVAAPLIVIGCAGNGSSTTVPTFADDQTFTATYSSTVSAMACIAGYKIYNSNPGVNNVISSNDLGSYNTLASCYIK